MTKDLNTENKILEAAMRVFTRKGYSGARMQEIADEAGINKGLLHYYFKSKDNLFASIFDQAFREFGPRTTEIFESDAPLLEKIELFVDRYIDFLMEHPYLPPFILLEINHRPEALIKRIQDSGMRPNPMKLMMQIQMEAQRGTIRPINPIHLVFNIISMCAFPFVARPMIQAILQIGNEEYKAFMADRKKAVFGFVKDAILVTSD